MPLKENKTWDLIYRGNVVARGLLFPVLASKKNELIRLVANSFMDHERYCKFKYLPETMFFFTKW